MISIPNIEEDSQSLSSSLSGAKDSNKKNPATRKQLKNDSNLMIEVQNLSESELDHSEDKDKMSAIENPVNNQNSYSQLKGSKTAKLIQG